MTWLLVRISPSGVNTTPDPPPRPALIDRCLVAAYDAGMRPVVVLTKSDLASPDEMLGLLGEMAARL